MSIQILCPIFSQTVWYFCYWVVWVLYIFWILTPIWYMFNNNFLPLCWLPFHFFICFFCCADAFKFDVAPFIDFCFCCLRLRCQILKSLSRPMSRSFFPPFSSRSFMVSFFILKYFIHFKLIFCEWHKMGVQSHCSACIHPVLLQRPSFLHWGLLAPRAKFSWPYVQGLNMGSLFCYIGLCYLFLCQFHTGLIIIDLQYGSKSGRMMPLALFFLRIA